MCRYPLILHLVVIGLVLVYLVKSTVQSEFDSQPKLLTTNDGSLFVEAARDKNITLRLTGDAALHINNVNILDLLKKRKSSLAQGTTEDALDLSISAVSVQLKNLKRDIMRLTTRLSNAENRTRVLLQTRRGRQFYGRVRRLLGRINLIETNLNLNECQDQHPCKNGASCYDLYKDYYCECMEGWSGKTCDEDIDECYVLAGSDLGCQNNAVCINIPGSYRCNCTTGFSGTHCRLRNTKCDAQQSSELCANGVCVNANNVLGYSCICNEGWSRNNLTTSCTDDVNECESTRNPCHSECINLPGSFRCGPCPKGYSGDGITCYDVDECAANNGGCSQLPLVPCINTEGSYHCGNCPPGWLGDGRTCTKAPSNICDYENICHPQARCTRISGIVVCSCSPGWYGHGFGENGCSVQMIEDQCDNHKCKNNGTCVASGRGTRCACRLGYIGPLCEQTDACNPNPCQNGGTCNLLLNNQFRCACQRGTTGTNCEILRNACGSIINQETGELTYPPDGGTYEPNERCAWIIRTGSTKILNVTFSKFDLEPDAECGKDWLQIHDGRSLAAQLIGRFCGNKLPLGGNIVSSHQQLFLWFRSDNATNGGGLKMSWTSQEHICGETLSLGSNDNGVIRSPGYPGKTPANRECEWNLNAPYGYRLILRFYEVTLGGDKNCTRDTLKIYDADQLLESICETSLPEPKHTSSNKARVHFHTDAYRADSSFQLHYEVVAGNPYCGGYFTEHTGIFRGNTMSPVCLYLIEQPLGTRIKLEFTEFQLFSSNNCRMQKIEVFDGQTAEAPLLKLLCGTDKVENIESSGNSLLVRYEYQLAGVNLPQNFEAKYNRICGEKFFGPDSGIIATPNYPQPYFEHLTCTYDIYGPINTVIHINFTDFSISESTPYMPEEDETIGASNKTTEVDDFMNYVDVYLSNDQKRRYYKGDSMSLVSARNRLRIVFHAYDNKRKSRGLKAAYSFETIGCGGVLTDRQGRFAKFGRPNSLVQYCEWVLEAPEGKSIKIDLKYTGSGTACKPESGAELFIYFNSTISGDHLVDSFCDLTDKSEVYHTNVMTVILNRPYGVPPNFILIANYAFIDDKLECGGNFTYRFGVIKSPDWPRAYPDGVDCTWIIAAPLSHKIELSTQNFSLEAIRNGKCDDYLEIRNGQSVDSPLIGKYCGKNIPYSIPSFTNHLYLHFHSDAMITSDGFYLTWQQTATGCGGKLNSHTGSIHSPHYPEISAGPVLCSWQIIVAESSHIVIKLKSVLENVCLDDVLTIYDGATFNSRTLKFNCTANTNIITLKSTSNQVAIRYALENGAEDGQQFLLDYETDCVRRIDDLLGVIESPNFPENYPPNLNCEWDIRGGRNNKISLIFSHLTLEKSSSVCNYDHLTLLDMRNEELLKTIHLCKDLPDAYVTEGNRIMLKFVSDYIGEEEGFRAEFKRLGCGEHFQKEFGSIQSPNAPYSVDIDCDWFIEVDAGKQIVLNINELHIETESRNCTSDVLRVSNDKNSVHYLTEECKVEPMPLTITSEANTMYIHFHTSAIRERKFFKATYRTRDATCGGIYRARNGVITSPNYPDKYLPNSMCVWSLMVEYTSGMIFMFKKLDLPSSEDCLDTYVDLNVVETYGRNVSRRWCGKKEKLVFFRNLRGPLEVTFKSGILPPSGGFVLDFVKSCGGYFKDTSSFLKSNRGDDCFWFIDIAEGTQISIDIYHLECQNTSTTNRDGLEIMDVSSEYNLTFCTSHPANIVISSNRISITAKNINLRAKYSSIQSSCGGSLSSLEGILTSPYYPNSYPSNIECIWEIQATKGNSIEINFDSIGITSSEKCNSDFLEIRQTDGGKLMGVFCGNQPPIETIKFGETVWLKFRSAEGSTGSGFKLRWNYAHINSLNGTQGMIEPPPVYSVQQQEEPYSWRINVDRSNLIRVNFKEYNKGLELYDGFDETANKINIEYSPWEFTSGTNVLFFKSNNAEVEHFKVEWTSVSKEAVEANQTISKCQEEILLPSDARVNISSPGYPKDYDNNLNCRWIVQTKDPTQHVVFHLFEANLESINQCSIDYLRASTSSNLLNWHQELQICESGPMDIFSPIAVIHGTPYLKLEFNTDGSVSRRGFTSTVTTACGSNMTLPNGIIISPTLTRARIHNSTCLWHIEVRSSKRIEFTFYFDNNIVKPNEVCRQYAIIYDGVDVHAPLLEPGQICNQIGRNVSRVLSTSNHATIKYNITVHFAEIVSTWNLTYREFSECGDEIRLSHGSGVTRNSPNYPNIPNPHSECTWLFLAPAGETLQVDFLSPFDMNVRYCSKEYVELFDGTTVISPSLGRYCRRPPTLRTSGNALYIRYLTDIAEPRMGFRVNVTVSTCGGTFTQTTGSISSAGYPAPGAYSTMSSCDYVIKLSFLFRIKLNFTDLHLPYNETTDENAMDHLEIFLIEQLTDGQRNNILFTTIYGNSSTSPPALEVDSNEVLIRFKSFKQNHQYRGFKIKYERNPGLCYKDVTGESGIFKIGYIPRVISFMVCRWKITVPKGQRVRIEVLNLERSTVQIPLINATMLRSTRPRGEFELSFYNSHDMLSKISEFTLSTYNSTQIIQSSDNLMYVRVQLGFNSPKKNIIARYTSNEESPCPDDILNRASGIISLRQLIETNANFYCKIRFTLSGNNETLALKILELQTVILKEYDRQFALVFRDESNLVVPFKTMNGNVTNTVIPMSMRQGSIGMLQTETVRILKFQAMYRRHACGGQYSLEDGFTLSSPKIFAEEDYGSIDCIWLLNAGTTESGFWLEANFTLTQSCEDEYIEIYASARPDNSLIAMICKESDRFNSTELINLHTTIVYHGKNYKFGESNFNFVVKKAPRCNDKVILKKLEKTYVNFPAKFYKNNMECVWEYEAVRGFYLSLTFVGRFFIEDSTNCTKDYLEVQSLQDGYWISAGRYCGREAPAPQNFSTNHIRLIFRTDENITAEGFSMEIQLSCFITFNVTANTQVLQIPDFNYLPIRRLQCEYILLTDTDDRINVHLIDRTTIKNCGVFSITTYKRDESVSDANSLILGEKYCSEAEFRANNYLKLVINAMYPKDVRIEFQLNGCGGVINRPTSIRSLSSENGDNYAEKMNCIWNVTAPEGNSIVIKFKYFHMEHSYHCHFDYLDIYKGTQMNEDERISKLCGNLTAKPPMITIDNNKAIIVAVSDESASFRGFSAQIFFTPNCNERITLTDGNSPVTLIRHLGSNETAVLCNYRIMAPSGYHVRLDIRDIQVSTPKCKRNVCDEDCNYIEIFDSVQEQRTSMAKYCNTSSRSTIKLKSSYEDTVVFASVTQPGSLSFEIVLEMELSVCGGVNELTLDDNTIEIIFPQNTKNINPLPLYPANTHCSWHFKSKDVIRIKFERFSLQNVSDVSGKCLDYVKLSSNYLTRYFCGTATGFDIIVLRAAETDVVITFHSDDTIESTGFHMVATHKQECNNTYTKTSGFINYLSSLTSIEVCSDEIRVPENYTISIYLPTFYFTFDNCTKHFARIIDIRTNKTLYEQCRHETDTFKLFTTTNAVRVIYSTNYFRLFYLSNINTSPPGCGGDIYSAEGELSNPPYDKDRNQSECRWDIFVPVPNRVRIVFNTFDMGSNVNCPLDYVSIIEVQSNNTEKKGQTYCGQTTPHDYISENSHIALISRKTPNFDGMGWTIYFEVYDEGQSWNTAEYVDVFQ